jgi:hypothetical protein
MTRIMLPAVLGATCVGLFVFAAKQEHLPRWLWGGLSLALWLLCWQVVGGGVLLILLGQAVLFAAMWVYLLRKAERR